MMKVSPEYLFAKIGQLTVEVEMLTAQVAALQQQLAATESVGEEVCGDCEGPDIGGD